MILPQFPVPQFLIFQGSSSGWASHAYLETAKLLRAVTDVRAANPTLDWQLFETDDLIGVRVMGVGSFLVTTRWVIEKRDDLAVPENLRAFRLEIRDVLGHTTAWARILASD